MGLAPAPQFPERVPSMYERKVGTNEARRGPLRFEEGVESDTDIPNEFARGAFAPDPVIVHRKWPEETMRERAHVGSASWIEAPTFLGAFAAGAGEVPQQYGRGYGSNVPIRRYNPVTVEG